MYLVISVICVELARVLLWFLLVLGRSLTTWIASPLWFAFPSSFSSFRCEIYLLRQRLWTPRSPHDMVQSSCELLASSMHWDFSQRRHRVNLPFLTVWKLVVPARPEKKPCHDRRFKSGRSNGTFQETGMRRQESGRNTDFCSNEGGSAGAPLEPDAVLIYGVAGRLSKG